MDREALIPEGIVRVFEGKPHDGGRFVGTGFFVDSTRALTAAHVAKDAEKPLFLQVSWGGVRTVVVSKVIYHVDGADVALLAIDEQSAAPPSALIRLGVSPAIRVGEDLVLIGFADEWSGADRRPAKVIGIDGVATAAILDPPPARGMSGGPTLSAEGVLRGIIWARDQDKGRGFVTPYNTFRKFLRDNGIREEEPEENALPEIACAIFVATREESESFRAIERLNYGKVVRERGYTIYPFEFRDRHHTDQQGHLVELGGAEPERAAFVSRLTFSKHKYKYVFVVGVSDQLSRDARVGDTVFATGQIFGYSSPSKITDGDGETAEIRLSSQVFHVDDAISELGLSLRQSEPTLFAQWKANSQEQYMLLKRQAGGSSARETPLLGPNSPGDSPRLVVGPIASGPHAAKSPKLVQLISQTNPGILALDSETARIAQECRAAGCANLIAIRGISDSIHDGQLLDEPSKVMFRRYAMTAASRLALLIIKNGLDFKAGSAGQVVDGQRTAAAASGRPDQPSDNNAREIFKKIREKYIAPGEDEVAVTDIVALESLFKLCTKQKLPRTHEKISLSLGDVAVEVVRLASGDTMWISGAPGVGKSLLARSLWKRLADDYAAGRSTDFPVYLNLGIIEPALRRSLELPLHDAINEIIIQDDEAIFQRIPPNSKVVLIIDGFEERNTFKEPLIKRYFRSIFRRYRGRKTVLVIDRTVLPMKSSAEVLRDSNLDSPVVEIGVRAVPTDSKECRDFAASYLSITRHGGEWDGSPEAVDSFMRMAEKLDVRDLDLLTMKTLVESSRRANFASLKNISALFLDLFSAKLRESFDQEGDYDSGDNHELMERFRRVLFEISFRILTQSAPFQLIHPERRKEGVVDVDALKGLLESNGIAVTASNMALALAGYSMLRSHPIFISATLADHVLGLMHGVAGAQSPRRYDALGFVYPTSINRAFKHLMVTSEARESAVLKSAAIIVGDPDAPELARAHAAYLLGRAVSRGAQELARDMLSETLRQIGESNDAAVASGLALIARRTHINTRLRLFRRGVLISLAYLGDEEAAVVYVKKVISDHVEDAVNRGFHLEYYGDVSFTPEAGLAHFDDLTSGCRRTVRELDKRIRRAIDGLERNAESAPSPNLMIEIATFCSIVQHRHVRGKLDGNVISLARSLLDLLIVHRGDIHPILRTYVAMVRRNLEVEAFREGDLLRLFYRLKREERAGWIKRRRLGKFAEGVRIESVADHSFMAAIIAYFYLPDWNPRLGPEYRKSDVIETLLIHDLCESFVGDHAKGEGYDEEIEMLWGMYIERLATYEKIHGAKRFWSRYKEFYDQSTPAARIAFDIDKIENLIQLYEYRDSLERDSFEKFEAGLIMQIQTAPGIHVRQSLQSLRDMRHSLDGIRQFQIFN